MDQHGASYIWGDIELFKSLEWTKSKEYEPMTSEGPLWGLKVGREGSDPYGRGVIW